MISIKYSEIPCDLHQSSLYKSLSAEEETEIPEHCYAHEDTIANDQDFMRLIHVTAFWGLYKIPLSVIVFCDTSDSDWAAIVKETHLQVPFAQDLLYIFIAPLPAPVTDESGDGNVSTILVHDESPLSRAIKRERTEIVEYLALNPSLGPLSVTTAAEIGRLDYLKLLHQCGHAWGMDACTQAMRGGHLDCLRYLHENGCPSHIPSLHRAAAQHNQLACLKYIIEQGAPWDVTANSIAAYGNLEMLKYACENGFVFHPCAITYAAENGHTECLRYLLCEANCPLSPYASVITDACSNGHVVCVQVLHEFGAPWEHTAFVAATRGGYLACIQYLHEHGCEWDAQTSTVAARRGDYEILRYAITHGCPYSPLILNDATHSATEGGWRCFRYLLEDVQIPTFRNNSHFNDAFARGNYYVVQYLLERDAKYKNHTIVWPLRCKWLFQRLHLDNHTDQLTKLDSDIVKCIQCALENNWDFQQCGGEMVQLIAEVRVILPQSFECVKPWFEKGLSSNK